MPGVFVCYQRSSTRHVAGRLYSRLERSFGADLVFHDDAVLRGGQRWWERINEWIRQADVLLVLVGKDWLELLEVSNAREAPEAAWVQREIVLAMESGIAVIPVLVDEAEMPTTDLPPQLSTLPELQAEHLSDRTFDHDVGRLVGVLEQDHGLHDPRSAARRRWERVKKTGGQVGVWLGVLAAILSIWAFFIRSGEVNRSPLIDTRGRMTAVAGVGLLVDLRGGASDPDGDGISLIVDATSAEGAEVIDNGDGTASYLAPLTFFGPDEFGYEVVDENGARTAGTVFIDVVAGEMTGELNVAVAEIVAVGDSAGSLARTSSQSIYELVVAGLEGDGLEIAAPDRTGTVEGATFGQQSDAVLDTADRLNAQVVIFGALSFDGGSTVVDTGFHLASDVLTGASELAGSYELGKVTVASGNPAAVQLELERVIAPTARAISELLRGLTFYQINRYPEAEAALHEAVRLWPTAPESSNGLGVLWHLLGNIAGEQGRLDEAEGFYETAITVGEDDARALFGLTQVSFQKAKGTACGGSGEPDLRELERAVAGYEAIQETEEPEQSFLHARSRVEVGRVLLCLHFYGEDRLDEARDELDRVVEEYGDEPRLGDLIGEAHQALALIHTLRGDHEASIAEYRLAIASTNEESRRAFFHIAIGGIYECDLGNRAAATREYALADAQVEMPLRRRDCDREPGG